MMLLSSKGQKAKTEKSNHLSVFHLQSLFCAEGGGERYCSTEVLQSTLLQYLCASGGVAMEMAPSRANLSLCCSVTETHSILWSADCQHSDGEEEWLTVIITCCINNTVLREAVKNCLNVLPLQKDKWRGRGFSGGVARDSCPTDTNTPWERGFICKQQLLHTNTFFFQLKSDDAVRYQRGAVVHLRSLLSNMD